MLVLHTRATIDVGCIVNLFPHARDHVTQFSECPEPGLRMAGISDVQSTTVDSSPPSVGSPCKIQSIRPSRSSSTACQVVGLGRPDRFAEGAETGVPQT